MYFNARFSVICDILFSMNIKQAKQYIKDIVKLYLKKDEYGEYRIPVMRQRPVLLLGSPGVGKTAIMEQIASELGIALVNYSMTHHTRQSALGLPFIVHKEYDGRQTDITEYTMSEIIASIYDVMEASGVKEGILFLDEINCVSETLAPAMLQFLQFKTFGKYSVPEGWVIVTAGNPPEYNKSVREFDVVTYDRLKLMEVEADFDVWKEYALDRRLHGAVLGYLELNKDNFYKIDTTVRGRGYVTARGWEDLSQIIKLYEEDGLEVSEDLVGQYLRNDTVVREFTAYYDLYRRYISDYCLEDILAGTAPEPVYTKAGKASFDERLSLVSIFSEQILTRVRDVMEESDVVKQIFVMLKAVREAQKPVYEMIDELIGARRDLIAKRKATGAYEDRDRRIDRRVLGFLSDLTKEPNLTNADREKAFDAVRAAFNDMKSDLDRHIGETSDVMTHILDFCVKAFGEGNELILLLTELTVDKDTGAYLARFPHAGYSELSSKLLLNDTGADLMQKIEALDL